jgi:hypothetical protein
MTGWVTNGDRSLYTIGGEERPPVPQRGHLSFLSLGTGSRAWPMRGTLSRAEPRAARESCFNRRSRGCSGDMESAPRDSFARSTRDICGLQHNLRPRTRDLPCRPALHSLGGEQHTPATSFQGAGCSRWSLLGSGLRRQREPPSLYVAAFHGDALRIVGDFERSIQVHKTRLAVWRPWDREWFLSRMDAEESIGVSEPNTLSGPGLKAPLASRPAASS